MQEQRHNVRSSAPSRSLRLYWSRPPAGYKENFGDELTPLIVSGVFGRSCEWSPPEGCEIAGAGSIIEMLLANKGDNRPALWGSGFIAESDNSIYKDDFEIVALRGAISRSRSVGVQTSAITLGDPGILADSLLTSRRKKTRTLGLIPHYCDVSVPEIKRLSESSGVALIDVTQRPEAVVQQIAECHTVISSSLHGLVVADSLSIPNVHARLTNKLIGGSYKFKDYYSAYSDPSRYQPWGRDRLRTRSISYIASLIEEQYVVPNDIDDIKDSLIRSFPDL